MTEHKDRDALRSLADAATPGSWEPRTDDLNDEVDVWANGDQRDAHVAFVGMPEEPRVLADAEFIAAARTAVPALLDALDQAEAERDEARATKDMHKERAQEAIADLDQAEARIKAVRELHKESGPINRAGWTKCLHCSERTKVPVVHPCATIRALAPEETR